MDHARTLKSEYRAGRAFTELEDTHSAHVAHRRCGHCRQLLGPGDPLGKEVRIDGAPYTVIGVGEAQGKMLGMSMDNWVAIPLSAFQESHGANDSIDIYVEAGGGGEVIEMSPTSSAPSCVHAATLHPAPQTPSARHQRNISEPAR